MAKTTVPYLTEDQIRKNYANQLSAFDAQRKAEADRANAAANRQYDNIQRSNYVDYRMNRRDMPEQLARQGITGGASETSLLRGQTNYENNRAATELQRGSRLGEINNAYLDALNNYKMTADQQMNDVIAQNKQLKSNYERQLQQEREQRFANNVAGYSSTSSIDKAIKQARERGEAWKIPYLRNQRNTVVQQQKAEAQAKREAAENRYANTISGWDTIKGIDKEIAAIRKSGKNTWRIQYLRARRAELAAAQKAEQQAAAAAASRSSGGGGGDGGDTPVYEEEKPKEKPKQLTREQAIAAVRKRFGIDGSKPKSTGSALASKAKSRNYSKPKGLGARLRAFR